MIAFEPNPSMLNTAATCNANKNETKYMLMFFIAAIKRSNSNYLTILATVAQCTATHLFNAWGVLLQVPANGWVGTANREKKRIQELDVLPHSIEI